MMRPQWGAFGEAPKALSASFVNQAAVDAGIADSLGLKKHILAGHGTRKLNKQHMLHNDACPAIRVKTFDVFVDDELATCEPAQTLPLTQRYMLR